VSGGDYWNIVDVRIAWNRMPDPLLASKTIPAFVSRLVGMLQSAVRSHPALLCLPTGSEP